MERRLFYEQISVEDELPGGIIGWVHCVLSNGTHKDVWYDCQTQKFDQHSPKVKWWLKESEFEKMLGEIRMETIHSLEEYLPPDIAHQSLFYNSQAVEKYLERASKAQPST